MNILLPERFDRKMMYTLIAQVIDEKYIPRYPSIAFDLQSLQFIRPSGVTVLSNLIQWLVKRGVHVVVSYPETSRGKSGKINPIKYLDDSGFFELYAKTKVFPESRLRTTTLPLRNVAYEEYHAWLEFTLMPWMMGQLAISRRDSLESLKICLQEIFNNIADHSTERIGCVFAQHYPAEKHVIIVASDFGIGIPNRIRQREGDLDDATALKKAVTEGYSTKTFSYRDGIRVSAKNCHGYYPGTLFEIIMNTASFYDVSQEEDFSWSS